MQKLKSVIFEPWGNEGQAHYIHSLCQELYKYSDITLITGGKYLLKNENKKYRVKYIANGLWFENRRKIFRVFKLLNYLKFLIVFYFYLKKNNPQIVHYQFLVLPFIDYYYLRILKKHYLLVLTVHDISPLSEKGYLKYKWNECFKLFDKLIVHSKFAKDEIINLNIADEQTIKMIPHGGYSYMIGKWPPIEKNYAKKMMNIKSKYVLILLGSILPYKGHAAAIEIMNLLVNSLKMDIVLVIAGSSRGESIEYLIKKINKNKLNNNIILWNKSLSFDEMRNIISCSDAGLMPYTRITTPGVGLMLQTYGIPLICTKIEGLTDLISDNINGFFICNEIEKTSRKIQSVLETKGEIEQMSQNSINKIKKEHNWGKIAEDTYNVYCGKL